MSLSEAYTILATLLMYLRNWGFIENKDFGIEIQKPQSWYLTKYTMDFLNSRFHAPWYMICESGHFYVETETNGWCFLTLIATEDYVVKDEDS